MVRFAFWDATFLGTLHEDVFHHGTAQCFMLKEDRVPGPIHLVGHW